MARPKRASWCSCSKGIPAKVNLIPFNLGRARLRVPTDAQSRHFPTSSSPPVIRAPVRTPRGRDILAACGSSTGQRRAAKRTSPRRAAPR